MRWLRAIEWIVLGGRPWQIGWRIRRWWGGRGRCYRCQRWSNNMTEPGSVSASDGLGEWIIWCPACAQVVFPRKAD